MGIGDGLDTNQLHILAAIVRKDNVHFKSSDDTVQTVFALVPLQKLEASDSSSKFAQGIKNSM